MSLPFLILTVLGLGSVVAAADWPAFHGGPGRSSVSSETGLARTWPEGGPPLLWSAKGYGEEAYAAPVVVGGRIILAGGRKLHAVDLATGTTVWSVPYHHCGSSTSSLDGGRIYSQGGGVVGCHALADGALLWQHDLKPAIQALGPGPREAKLFQGWNGSPVVGLGKVFVITGHPKGFVAALDAATGKPVWQTAGPDTIIGQGHGSPALVRHGQRDLLLVPTDYDVFGVDPADGRLLWRGDMGGQRPGRHGQCNDPLYVDGLVINAMGYGHATKAFRLNADGSQITEAWSRPLITPFQENQVAWKGLLFGFGNPSRADAEHGGEVLIDGRTLAEAKAQKLLHPDPRHLRSAGLVCQDLATGVLRGLRSDLADPKQDGYSGPMLIAAEDRLFVLWSGRPMRLALVSADARMEILGRAVVPAPETLPPKSYRNYTAPALVDGRLLVREHDNLWCYDVRRHP